MLLLTLQSQSNLLVFRTLLVVDLVEAINTFLVFQLQKKMIPTYHADTVLVQPSFTQNLLFFNCKISTLKGVTDIPSNTMHSACKCCCTLE